MLPCYSLELCIQMGIYFLFAFAFHISKQYKGKQWNGKN